MMLGALYELAQREGLLDDPDYERKRVDYLIRIDEQGRFLTLVPTADENGRAKEYLVPRLPKRTVKITPGFFFDKAQYVLGLGPETKPGRNAKCLASFRATVEELVQATDDVGARAVLRFLDRLPEQVADVLSGRRADDWDPDWKQELEATHPEVAKGPPVEAWTGSEWLLFVLDADGTEPVHQREAIRSYWAGVRQTQTGGASQRCLVTGQLGPPAVLHDSIKGLARVGAQSSGAALVSFNEDAFCSQGLEKGANAPVLREAAEGYVTALNWLLERTEGRAHRYGVGTGDGAVTVFWTAEANPFVDVFASLCDPTADEAAAWAEAPFKGLEPGDIDESAFYAVTLGGNAARVVVRDWITSTVGSVKENVRQYFQDLTLGDESAPLPLPFLLWSLEAPSGQGVSPHLGPRLFRAALTGQPFPREFVGAALRRLRLPDKKPSPRLLLARCALIKATLIRLPRPDGRRLEVSVSLDPTNQEVPYLLGRLFAVLERLQAAALKDLNASIRDRWFGSASSTPALVFPRLLRLSVHHAAKAEKAGCDSPGYGYGVGSLNGNASGSGIGNASGSGIGNVPGSG